MNNKANGFIRIATCSPRLYLGDVQKNAKEILSIIKELQEQNVQAVLFPELCLTGSSLGDVFSHSIVAISALNAVKAILAETKNSNMLIVLGLPFAYGSQLYNSAFVLQCGKILGIVAKEALQNNNYKNDARFFSTAENFSNVSIDDETIAFGGRLVFENFDFSFSVCQGEADSSINTDILFNMDSSVAMVSAHKRLENALSYKSHNSILVYANSGFGESSSYGVYDGFCGIYEHNKVLVKSERFLRHSHYSIADCDFERVKYKKRLNNAIKPQVNQASIPFNKLDLPSFPLLRPISPLSFVPAKDVAEQRYDEILNIQLNALITRLDKTGINTMLIGVSGGLDSTLCLLVATKACDCLGLDRKNIHGISMPGFGTGQRTRSNADALIETLGISGKTISIEDAVRIHFRDIGHDESIADITYENSQARERTQILMDYANKLNGIVLGTGDMSESALGFATFNGDHMSMYNINASIPKTIIRPLIKYISKDFGEEVYNICQDIIATPISPELLPASKGELKQKTEDIIGNYELHDFFFYNMFDSGASRAKLMNLAVQAFDKKFDREYIEKVLDIFIRRFFSQQFKRNCVADSPRIGSISLSPHGAFIMPSDMYDSLWKE